MNLKLTGLGFCLALFSFDCNNSDGEEIPSFFKDYSDSIRYYKDVDWITFEGIGPSEVKPSFNYPYTGFNYRHDTVDMVVFFSKTHHSSIQLLPFFNGSKYYSTRSYSDGKYITYYTLFNKLNKKRIEFWGDEEMDITTNGNVRKVEYHTKKENNYYTNVYWGHFNSKKLPWQQITEEDSVLLKEYFCYFSSFVNEFVPPNSITVYYKESSYCNNENNTTTVSLNKDTLSSEITVPSMFYHRALKNSAFKELSK